MHLKSQKDFGHLESPPSKTLFWKQKDQLGKETVGSLPFVFHFLVRRHLFLLKLTRAPFTNTSRLQAALTIDDSMKYHSKGSEKRAK